MIFPPRKILLNPGPTTTSDTVKGALVMSDLCPREADFGAIVSAVRRDLLAVAEADAAEHTAILLSGPGTAAVEAALGSLVPPGGRVLILANGAYGARAGEIAAALRLPARVWEMPWTVRPDPAALAAELDGPGGPFTHAFWVHHETTTGLLNPLRAYGAVCRAQGVTTIVDGMSSFAGLPLALRDEPVDLLISSANKCLQGMPGVSFVLARRAALAASAGIRRSVALDLHRLEGSLAAGGQFLFTPPVQVVHALARALTETLAETVAGRAARYRACYETMLAGMENLGFAPLLPRALHSGLLTAFCTPSWPRFSFAALHDHLYARGITLYPGKLPGADTFRVANMGALVPADLAAFVAEVGRFLDAR
jgi:2-aminoethylphosphonate-pyruvate transaminase